MPTWGGARRGAGRPRTANRESSVPHRARPEHDPRHPVHLTLRAREGLPSFRMPRAFAALRLAIARASSDEFRIVQFSVQADHLHAIVEATDKRSLALGVAGFRIRAARAFNRALRRSGPVWSGKYHARALRSPREARTAIVYVLLNWKKHVRGASGIDGCSSGPWFDGWVKPPPPGATSKPVVSARTWLAARGWLEKGGGAIALGEKPASGSPAGTSLGAADPRRSSGTSIPEAPGDFVALSRSASSRPGGPRDRPAPARTQ